MPRSTTPRAEEDHRSAGEVEDDSCTRRKKSRRVSFAETTVHVFNRDESSGSPARSKPSISVGRRLSDDEETVGFRGYDSHGDDSVGSAPEEEDEEDGVRLRFVADMDSSSPGSAVGSVTSNEDDNFFGPVSSSFINSGRLSESGMSDDNNHDVTLDSTAFSLHFRNIAPPDDRLADSAGSLKTPSGDTTSSMPLGFLVRGDKSEELETKHSFGKMSNGSEDWNKISPILRDSDKYDYGKLSETLESLMDQVNISMQPNSPNEEGRIKSSRCDTDEIEPEKDGAVIGNQDSFYDESCHSIDYPYLPMGQPSNELLSSANAEALTSHSNSEKIQDSLMATDGLVKVHVAIHPEIMIPNGQKFNPQHRVLENDFNIQSNYIHQKHSSNTSEGECYPASSLYHSSAFLSTSEDAQKLSESACIADTPKNIAKLFHSSLPESMSTSQDDQQQQQQPQQFVSQPVPSSSKFMCVSDRGHPESLMETPANAVKTFQLLQGSVSSFQAKQRQLLDFSVLPQSELIHTPRDQFASLKLQLIEHGERISSIKNHITSSRAKARIQSDYEPASSRKDHCVTNLQNILDEIIDGSHVKQIFTSDLSADAKKEYPAKQMISMNISDELDRSGNASCLIGLDKNAAVFATVEKDQTERTMEFHCNSPLKMLDTLGAHSSSIEKGIAGPDESNRALNISSKPISAAADISAAERWDGCVTLGAEENTKSSCSNEGKNSQLITTIGPYTEKVNNLENIKVHLNSDNYGRHGKMDLAVSEGFHFGGSCMNTKLNETLANMSKKITGRQMIDPYCRKASGKIPKLNAALRQSLESSSEEVVCCPNDMAKCHNDNFHSFNNTDVLSPKRSQAFLSHVHGSNRGIQFQLESYSGCDFRGVGGKGKKQTYQKENADSSESDSIQNSSVTIPNIVGDSGVVSIDPIHHDEAQDIVGKASQKHWNDVLSRASAATNGLLPHSVSEQHLHKLDDVEDLLAELQTARKYNGICFTLRNHNCLSDLHQKRVVNARLLLEKLGFAKARNELKRLKLKKLHDKAKLLQSKGEECKKLKSIYSQLCVLIRRAVEPHELSDCGYQEIHNRVMAMRQEIEVLEQKIKLLLKSFETSFKLKENMSCDDVIKAVDENLTRRVLCKHIQQHTQLWKLSDVGMINNHYEIVLGYCDLLFQRFTIDKNQVLSIVANNSCNKPYLGKKFPNMNACVAFDFVFKLNFDRKLATSSCIYQETLETNLIIGTLIAVLEEILVSRLEFWNLISSTFLKQFSGELQLQLCFYSSRNGQKITLGLDMTSLNRGIYPADPSEIKIQVHKQQTTLSSSIVDEVIGAARSLQGGHFVILRLCRCISQVVQRST